MAHSYAALIPRCSFCRSVKQTVKTLLRSSGLPRDLTDSARAPQYHRSRRHGSKNDPSRPGHCRHVTPPQRGNGSQRAEPERRDCNRPQVDRELASCMETRPSSPGRAVVKKKWRPLVNACCSRLVRRCPVSCAINGIRSEEHTSELQSFRHLVCRLLLDR